MKKMVWRRNNPTIKRKLIALVVGHLLLFAILVYALLFWFQSVLENKISALAQQTMETLTGNVEVYMNNNVRLSNTIASDSALIKQLRENPNFSSSTSIWSMVQLLDNMKNFSVMNPYIYSIAIYNPESGKILSTTDGIYDAPAKHMDWVEQMLKQKEPLAIRADLAGVVPEYRNMFSHSMISILRELPGNNQKNILMINSNKETLDMFIGNIELWKETGIVISDLNDEIIYTSGNLQDKPHGSSVIEQAALDQEYQTISYGGKKYIVVKKHSEVIGWNVHLIIPHKEIMQDVMVMQRVAIFILLGIAILVLLLFSLLYVQIFNPIKKLMKSMVVVEKGLPFRPIPINRMDELGFLQKRFNDMVLNEQQMRKTILEEQLHKKEIELKFLQSQVNPHFLYNTLDSIYWVAEQSKVEEISDVVLDLSKFFRLSLSRGKDYVTIRESVEHLECYLRIQQFRHIDKFEVYWELDDRLSDIHIMKLMLQPVVENAIIHGLERATDACKLTIQISQQGEYLCCCVSDTGIGMDTESLQYLLHEIKQEQGPSGMTYGLRNLYQRLHILYSEDMQFDILSKPTEGTLVEIRILLSRLGGKQYEKHEGDHR